MSSTFSVVELIAKKRDGGALTTDEIAWFVSAFQDERIADYQMSAILMAIYLRGMDDRETADLTLAMARSGDVLSWPEPHFVDKHSTGGVGDGVSLVLAPLAASLGLCVPMLSGRGLGFTGGTLDKLESLTGYQTALSLEDFSGIVREVGCSIMGPTAAIAPVDKRIYAIRDTAATTESLPLLCSSIMSKKIAEAPRALVIDVKTGRGAFLKKWDESVALAEAMVAAGENAGIATTCVLTSMDQPLGHAVGNALEVRETLEVLRGGGPADMVDVTVELCAHMLVLGGRAPDLDRGRESARENLANGKALAKFEAMVARHGGDMAALDAHEAKHTGEVRAQAAGVVHGVDPLEIGLTSVALGAGRQRADEDVDFAAGIVLRKKVGDAVEAGDVLAVLHTNRADALAAAQTRVQKAFTIAQGPPKTRRPLIQGLVTKDGLKKL